MINKRNYINNTTLIDSECDRSLSMISTPQPYSNNNVNFYRSPLRDRENKMNLSNTPLRSGKQSLSPLRLRKVDNIQMVNNSIRATKRKPMIEERPQEQNACFNHHEKFAKFFVQTHDQLMYYCEKCAILLASQGFPVKKIQTQCIQQSSSSFRRESNPRKQEIQHFMSNLQVIQKQLKSTSSTLDQNLNTSQTELQQELTQIEQYYEQFYEILNLHKQRVLMEIKEEYQKINSPVFEMKKEFREAVDETESMKKDILESWDDIIFVAEEHQYRPVINAYIQKLQAYQSISTKGESLPELRVRKLNFVNTDAACEALEKGLEVEWEDQEEQEEEQNQNNEERESQVAKYSKQSDLPENLVECLQKDEKFIKSSLKDLVGLFSSFEE